MFEKNRTSKSQLPGEGEKPSVAPTGATSSRPAGQGNALIGASIKVLGEVSGDENLTIEGIVEGAIVVVNNDVRIGQSGRITADITAKTIKVDGEVFGNIIGHELVVISRTGKVQGNIEAPRVTLEDGAKFKGSIDMDPSEADKKSGQPSNIRSAGVVGGVNEMSDVVPPSASSRT